jgi:hypothetical protein
VVLDAGVLGGVCSVPWWVRVWRGGGREVLVGRAARVLASARVVQRSVGLDELGRMLALDAIVFNEDRHRRDLLVEPAGDEAHLTVWAIDAGKAEIGWPGDFVARGSASPSPHNHARGLPVGAMVEPALAAATLATTLREDALRALVAEARAIAREPAVGPVSDALVVRCRSAPEIVARNLEALGGLR